MPIAAEPTWGLDEWKKVIDPLLAGTQASLKFKPRSNQVHVIVVILIFLGQYWPTSETLHGVSQNHSGPLILYYADWGCFQPKSKPLQHSFYYIYCFVHCFNFLYFFCWGGGDIFGGMMKLWIFFLTFWGVISYILGLFLKVKVQNLKMFLRLLCFVLYVPSSIFLAHGYNAVTLVWLEPAAPRSRVNHSTTEPLRCRWVSTTLCLSWGVK